MGTLQWTTAGVLVCTGSNSSFDPSIVSDNAGGAIISWFDHRNGVDIYAQRIDASGNLQWTANGLAICNINVIETSNGPGPVMIGDGVGGAILSWSDTRNGNADIYCQRINSSGMIQWASQGKPVCILTGNQTEVNMVADDAGGAIIAWKDDRNGNADIYAQRINPNGTQQWSPDGSAICIWGGGDANVIMINDGANGAIIAWLRNNGLYAQKINSSGELQWTDPVAMCANTGITVPAITSDGAGGAITAWMELRNSDYNIYAQRVLASGTVTWGTSGADACVTPGSQGYPVVVENSLNGAFVSWNNGPPGGVNAQNINDDGTTGPPATALIGCPTGNISINSNVNGTTYKWQVNAGTGFSNIADNSNYSGTNSANLHLNNIPSSWYGYIYRCVVNGGTYSGSFKLRFSDTWIGSTGQNWENPTNWNCGMTPDANTDVVISSGTVVVNSNTTVRTLTLAPNVNLTVAPGVTLTVTHQ
ncbi:MAG TPA: hypothetical protein VFI06_01960 [Chitinophagaceae bacterium]|nr:hypothetical protein [Chitinophagaceae bacterium]